MRLLLRGLWWRRGLTLAVLAVAVVTVTTAALGPLYARASAESILQDHLSSAGSSAGLHFDAQVDLAAGDSLAAERRQLPRPGAIRGYSRVITGLTTSSGLDAYTPREPLNKVETALTWRAGQCQNVVLVQGHCPTRAGEAVASERTVKAGIYGWRMGARILLDTGGFQPTVVHVTGVYRPRNPDGAFWFGGSYFDAHGGADTTPDTVDTMFVARQEFTGGAVNLTTEADFDYPLNPSSVRLDDVAAEQATVARLRARYRTSPLRFVTSLPSAFAQAAAERRQVDSATLLVTLQLAVLAWLVLFQVVSDALEARGNEIAMAKLRGLSPWRTARFGMAEPLALLVVAIPIGILAALGVTALFASSVLVAGVPVLLTWSALWTALAAFAGGVVAAALAGYRILTRPVLDQWRRTERQPGRSRLLLAVDLLLAAGAVAAFVALRRTGRASGSDDTLALLAPALLVFAVATVGVRLLPPLCRTIADGARATRRIGTFLAARQVSRRPVGLRLATLLAVAVGLATFGVAGETVAAANRVARADAELGAGRVLSVEFNPDLDPVQATQRADPEGRWAMAAATWLPDGGDSMNGTLLGVDARRLAAVGLPASGGPSTRRLAALIDTAEVPAISVRTGRMRVHLTATGLRGDQRPNVQLNFRTSAQPYVSGEGGVIRPGAHTYEVPVTCRTGCLLRSLTWDRPVTAEDAESGTLTLTGLDTDVRGRWRPLSLGLTHPRSWYRLTPQGQADDRITVRRSGVQDRFSNENGGYGGISYAADASPLPMVITPRATIVGDIVPHPRQVIDGEQIVATFVIRKTVRVLPRVGDYGAVTDVRYLENELPDFVYEASWQVWVGADAPADYRRLLTRAGLQIVSEQRVGTRVDQLGRQAPALALLLLLACALAGAVLAVGGTAISISSSSRRRSYELASLRVIGVRRRSLLRAAVLEQLFLLGAATVLGVPAGLIAARLTMPIIPQFADRTPILLRYSPHLAPTLAFAAGFVVLLVITALVAARALVRVSVPSRLRESE